MKVVGRSERSEMGGVPSARKTHKARARLQCHREREWQISQVWLMLGSSSSSHQDAIANTKIDNQSTTRGQLIILQMNLPQLRMPGMEQEPNPRKQKRPLEEGAFLEPGRCGGSLPWAHILSKDRQLLWGGGLLSQVPQADLTQQSQEVAKRNSPERPK